MAPSPTVFLSAAAQRTEKLRLGALSWVLPIYDPLRLYEELCMLDHISNGRLEMGLSRGASPHESLRHGVVREESRARYDEIFALMLGAFRDGRFNGPGPFYKYDNLVTRFRPLQKPYPPIWYPTSNLESIPRVAAQGFNFVVSLLNSPNLERAAEMLSLYRKEYEAHRQDPNRLNAHVPESAIAFSTHVHVADSDSQAYEQARIGYMQFNENYTRRYVEIGQSSHFAGRPTFEQYVEQGRFLCGSPDSVREKLARVAALTGANHFVGVFTFGDLSYEQTKRSVELFAREVMPAFAS
jgi:alkanesulfonate monooxygenase SsuD/methylene tetrahydromethanopterin reductase-like flavin-dependent oxidoreductase (luciferase family)